MINPTIPRQRVPLSISGTAPVTLTIDLTDRESVLSALGALLTPQQCQDAAAQLADTGAALAHQADLCFQFGGALQSRYRAIHCMWANRHARAQAYVADYTDSLRGMGVL